MLVHKTLFVCFFSIISLGTDKIDKNYVRNIETKTLYDLSEKKEQCFTERTEALSELNILSQELIIFKNFIMLGVFEKKVDL